MRQVRLLGGKVVEVEDRKAARLVRKFGARYIEAAIRAPQERAVLPRAMGRTSRLIDERCTRRFYVDGAK